MINKTKIFANKVTLISYISSLINNKSMKVVFSYNDFQNKYENEIGRFYMHSNWFKTKADELIKIYKERTKGKSWVQYINE